MQKAKVVMEGPLGKKIMEKVTSTFKPSHVEVINESHMHSVPKNSETHFKLVVVSTQFEGQTVVNRHRLVNKLFEEELKTPGGIHALSLILKTPEQWAQNSEVSPSPTCRGGSKS